MSDAVSIRSVAYAQIRVREPLGERVLGERASIGGTDPQGDGPDVVVPGAAPGRAVMIERRKAVWVAEPSTHGLRLNGRPFTSSCDLHKHDTISLGDAQIVVADVSRTLLRVDVHHLAGNTTIAPAATLATLVLGDGEDQDAEIHPLETLRVSPLAAKRTDAAPARGNWNFMTPRRWAAGGLAATVLVLAFVISSLLQPVSIDVRPTDAHVLTPGTFWAIHQTGQLLLFPGKHLVRAERAGYYPAQETVQVGSGDPTNVRLRLEKLPGKLHIDTGGISAAVSVDGVAVGHAPGVLSVPAGTRTLIVTAPHYLDFITNLDIQGAGQRQDLRVNLQSSWGALEVLSIPAGGRVSVDGVDSGVSPVTIPAPSGVRRVQIVAPGHKTWESSIVLKAGETLKVGPVTLGQPDAHLTVRSEPPGADATVAGTHLGRTPAEIDLPSGIAHQVVLSAPGYKNWVRAVFADPGRKLSVLARLEPIMARVSVRGEPGDADLIVDGVPRGKTPQSLDLSATGHRIEIRKSGFQPFNIQVTPAVGLDRTVQYQLNPVSSTNTGR